MTLRKFQSALDLYLSLLRGTETGFLDFFLVWGFITEQNKIKHRVNAAYTTRGRY